MGVRANCMYDPMDKMELDRADVDVISIDYYCNDVFQGAIHLTKEQTLEFAKLITEFVESFK